MGVSNIVGVIPARYDSSRFPGKPLADIYGKSMIRRVYEQAAKVQALSQVVVATDDERISKHVQSWGGRVAMTATHHKSGTERCAEVAASLSPAADIIVNIQGDEPYIQPSQIQSVIDVFGAGDKVAIASLAKPLYRKQDMDSPHVVKVVMDKQGRALYFSRAAIPFWREGMAEGMVPDQPLAYKHIGLYAYTNKALQAISKLAPHALEQAEALEQLRWLANAYTIQMAITDVEAISVDTPDDLDALIAHYAEDDIAPRLKL